MPSAVVLSADVMVAPKAAKVRLARPPNATRRAPRKKTAYHHGDLRRALLDAALVLLEERGPEALTLREVASRVGVTHPAAYRHFEDKTALLAAVAEEGYVALSADVADALSRASTRPDARLRAIAAAFVDFALRNPARYRVMWGPRLNTDGRFPALEAAISHVFELVQGEVARGQETGVFRDGKPRDLAVGLWVVGHGYVELVARRRIKVKSREKAVEYFLTLFEPWLDGLER